MERLNENYDVNITWRSFELRPRSAPPISEEYKAKILADRPRLYAIAREHYGLEMNPGPFGIDSRPSLIGAKYAEEQGKGEVYNAAVLKSYWHDAQDISQLDVLYKIAETVGLEVDTFKAALSDPQYSALVDGDIMIAYRSGISGVPALVFENKYLVSGAQPYEVLEEVTQKLQQNGVLS